ncbi:ABC transporter permease [Piscinibacter sp.]|uniref:ABC transporter permease n=1 Tax=Piscinibacter sp. TaxID=1903157 RepID=UPI002BEEE8A1|nr:FtsX-like permease family protein [Albitalea sp.]HUG25833.1 FtsX-like permease family protein [Albitalea sp.]
MRFLLSLAWRDLRSGGRPLWVFAACLMLGVALVGAGGGLYRQVAGSLQADVRALFGGDVEVQGDRPLDEQTLAWMRERGEVSLLVQLRTMLRSADGRSQLVEMQSADDRYPLYGALQLEPAAPLAELLARRDGAFGIALDAVLARRMALVPGDRVEVGDAELVVRALLRHQPDRSLRADWGRSPVLVSDDALAATGLVQDFSRVGYRYRVRTAQPPAAWRDAFLAAFPKSDAQVRSVDDRSDRIARLLGQVGSGLLLVGFSALFIGGLGVFNSVQAYLGGKLGSLATLRALGLRDARLAGLVLLQVLLLALGASIAGALAGALLAIGGVQLAADQLPIAMTPGALLVPLVVAIGFGVLTALAFALPAVGRAVTVSPAALFRGIDGGALRTPRLAWAGTALVGALLLGLLVQVMPEPRLGLAFIGVSMLVLALLEALLRMLRALASRLLAHPGRWRPGFELRVALSGLQRPGSPLRASLLSLGSALTLLVACTLVVAALLRTVNETVPQQAPALVFHDVQTDQLATLKDVLQTAPSLQRSQTAPLVLGRLAAVNGEPLRDSDDARRRREARDEHKLSHREGNIDDVIVTRGAWWPAGHRGRPLLAMEDREADQLGLQIGDQMRFEIMGTAVDVELAAIYAQRRLQARLWLEGILSDGVLDPFVTRHVGAAYLSADDAIAVQDRLAAAAPNVVTVRTEALLETTRGLMARASAGLVVIAGACLAASLLVLASVVAASRARQVYEASVMHVLGARVSSLRRVLRWEYALLALVTAAFAIAAGSALAFALLRMRMELDAAGLYWTGALTAVGVSAISLGAGAQVLLAQLKIAPARLLRSGG